MKKKVITVFLLALFVSLTACSGGSDESTQKTGTSDSSSGVSFIDYDPADYVQLGEYKGIDVVLDGDYSTDDEAFNKHMEEIIAESAGYEKDPDAVEIKEDSIVNLDYMGIKDGEAFDGGTAEDQTIDVANNCAVGGSGYIDGFTSGLVGHKVGETVDCDVTFPENYGSKDLAGQQVIFRFTINYICKPGMTLDQLTDEYVSENLGSSSVDEYLKAEREAFESDMKQAKESALRDAVMDKVVAGSKINSYPEDVINARMDQYIDSYKEYASDGDVEKYIKENLGVSMDEFKKQMRGQVEESLDYEMVFLAVAEKEGLEDDDEGFESYVKETMDRYGATDRESYLKNYGADAKDGEAYLRRIYRCNRAVDFCIENVGKVTP